ncbi:MAG: hypothetical protein IMY82_03205 [Chloroflexi bacterium]|nr:hypothetical protein [Chloroflexota bacterium]
MDLKLFGFSEKSFHVTQDPRIIFLSKNHEEAFTHLLYGDVLFYKSLAAD